MLTIILAWIVGLGSLGIYLAAFFFPEIHRKNDFIWSGVGFFYALVLWVYAGQIKGGLLLGQTASVALLCWLGWQAFTFRRELIAPEQRTPTPGSLPAKVQGLVAPLQGVLQKLPLPGKRTPLPQPQTAAQVGAQPKSEAEVAIAQSSTETTPIVAESIPVSPAAQAATVAEAEATAATTTVEEVTSELVSEPPAGETVAAETVTDELITAKEELIQPEAAPPEAPTEATRVPTQPSQVPPSAKRPKPQEKITGFASGVKTGLPQIQARVTSVAANIKEPVQKLLSRFKREKPQTKIAKSIPVTPTESTGSDDLWDEDLESEVVAETKTDTAIAPESTSETSEDFDLETSEPAQAATQTSAPEVKVTEAELVTEFISADPPAPPSTEPPAVAAAPVIAEPTSPPRETSTEEQFLPAVEAPTELAEPTEPEILAPEVELPPPAAETDSVEKSVLALDQELTPDPMETKDTDRGAIEFETPPEEAKNLPPLIRPNPPDPSLIQSAKAKSEPFNGEAEKPETSVESSASEADTSNPSD